MSKRLKSKSTADGPVTSQALVQGAKAAIDTMLEWVATPTTKPSQTTFYGLRQWAQQDIGHFNESLHAGQAFKMFLDLPIDQQRTFVWAMADALKVDRPTYEQTVGRPTSGKQQLAQVLYAPWPELLEKVSGSNETPAAQRITHSIRRFEGKVKAYNERKKAEVTSMGVTTRAYKSVFIKVWEVLHNDEEKMALINGYRRLGFDYMDDLNKWVAANEVAIVVQRLMDNSTAIRTITASSSVAS